MQLCRQQSIDAIELRMGLNDWSSRDMDDAELAQLKLALKKAGVAVSNLGTSVVIHGDDPEQSQALEKYLRVAQALDARGLRIMLGSYKVRYSDVKPVADEPAMVNWLKRSCDLAAQFGAELWLETHNEYATIGAMRRVVDQVSRPNLKILWDLIHPLELGETLDQSLSLLGDSLAHVHIKDGKPWDDPDLANWKYTKLGEGQIPLAEVVGKLQARGYDGFYSLEWESAWRPEIRGPGFEGEIVIPHFAQYMRGLQ